MNVSRREFVSEFTVAAAAGVLGLRPHPAQADPPPETTRLKLLRTPSICEAPAQVASGLLESEGFTDVQYVKVENSVAGDKALASGEVDLGLATALAGVMRIDAGDPRVLLSGVHVGCFELFGTERVRSVRDLKGKTVAVPALGDSRHAYIASMAAYVGVDPRKDINWVVRPGAQAIQLLAEGKIDALIGFPPEPQQMRAQKIGHVVVNTTSDRPWSEYFCCMVTGNREFVRKYPIAAKRATRAILKARAVCELEPERAAKVIVDRGYPTTYDLALQTLKEIPFGKWRVLDPEDTVRFFALRLREAGMIKSSPQQIIAQGTDWRFVNELKRELKG
jgi:NitT/TauT family transport system substrate-binding protein